MGQDKEGEYIMEQIYSYTIKLIRYVLNGDISELPEEIDFEQLFAFGKSHGVENLLYVGLRDLKINVPVDIMKKFQTAYEMQIMVEATQALELEVLTDLFEENKIDNLPLKGSVIRYLYPMPDYRKSGDIDILIHPEDEEKVHDLMLESGYELIERDTVELHLEYRKPPYLMVEIHLRLVETDNRAYTFFSNIWDMAAPVQGLNYRYEMDKECFYAFIIAHLCKHIHNFGAGIKFIPDIWLLLKSYEYDEKKLGSILKAANIDKFEKWARQLANMWMGGVKTDDPTVHALAKFIVESGSFGSIDMNKKIRASVATDNIISRLKYKIKWLFKGTFLPYNAMRHQYPYIGKYKFLYPVTWIMRIFRMLTKEKRTISSMVRAASGVNDKESKPLRALWEAVREL